MNDKTSLMDEIAQIRDEKRLLEIYSDNDDIGIRYAIVNLIDDDEILHEIFAIEEDDFIKSIVLKRISADFIDNDDLNALDDYEKISFIEKLDDESLLARILENDENFRVRIAAILRIRDMDLLSEIAGTCDDYDTRIVIYKKLAGKPILDEINGETHESRLSLAGDLDNENFLKDIAINEPDEDVRRCAFERIEDADALADIAKNARYGDVLKWAAERIEDENVLSDIAKNSSYEEIRLVAVERIEDENVLLDIVNCNFSNSREYAVKKIDDESILVDIAKNASYADARRTAVEKIADNDVLVDIAKNDRDYRVRLEAVKKIADNDVLVDIAKNDDVYDVRLEAVKKIADNDVLVDIAKNDNRYTFRLEAVKKVSDEDVLADVLRNDDTYIVRLEAVKKVSDEDVLVEVLSNDRDDDINYEIVRKISDKDALEGAARNDSNHYVKREALKKLNKPQYYSSILDDYYSNDFDVEDELQSVELAFFFSSDQRLVKKAVNNIATPSILFELCRKGPYFIRKAALEKLIFGNVFSTEKIADKISFEHMIPSDKDDDYWIRVEMKNLSWSARCDAVRKITDVSVLADIVRNDYSGDIRIAAVKKITDEDVLIEIARNNSYYDGRREAVHNITDEKVLEDFARNDGDAGVRRRAVEGVSDEDVLLDVLRNDGDEWVRLEAVKRICDENVLEYFARNDGDVRVRLEAVKRIYDENVLEDFARNDGDEWVRREAVEGVSDEDVLIDVLRNDGDAGVRREAVKGIGDEDVLLEVLSSDPDYNVRIEAVKRISDNDVLVDVFRKDPDFGVRREAVKRISDEDILVDIAMNDRDEYVRRAAVGNITDSDVLRTIFINDPDEYVRQSALEGISDENVLQRLVLENYGYFSIDSFSSFKRSYDKMIYESIGIRIYEDILDKISDESVLAGLMHEKLFGDFRVLVARRLTSEDELRNLALNDMDYRVRISAVKNPNLCDEKTFRRIFESDYNDAVRLEALKRIDDGDTIKCATNDLNPLLRIYAYGELGGDFDLKKAGAEYEDIDSGLIETIDDENVLYEIASIDSSASVRRQAFDKITDEHILFNLACRNRQFTHMALKRIDDNDILLNIALYFPDKSVARKAVKRIDDEEFLLWAVQNNPYNDISPYIINRFRDESLLEIIALNNSNPFNRKAAVKKIKSSEILIRLGEVECEEVVCTAIVKKCRNRNLLEYMGLSNPYKTVRRYVESVTDDEELLYRFALKEYEWDNRREIISKMTNERCIADLLKRESYGSVFRADFEITDEGLLMDLFENSYSFGAKRYAAANISDKSIIRDFVYASPFVSRKPEKDSVRQNRPYYEDMWLVLYILAGPHFNDMKYIENFLIQNDLPPGRYLNNLCKKVTDISSIRRIRSNCKSEIVRGILRDRLENIPEYEHDNDDEYDEDISEEEAAKGLGALFR